MVFKEAVSLYKAQPEKLDELVNLLLGEMTVKEKLYMLKGHALKTTVEDFLTKGRVYNAAPYAAGGCERLGIPPLLFCDGPRGVVLGNSTCFPVPMLRGASFDEELEYRIGEAFAGEAMAGGANLFAGICINLLRHPKWGRAQETYGEDPFLLGRMGAALTAAVSDCGMIACTKHFALNSVENHRFSVDAQVDDRTLREVCLPHFKKCIDAGAMSVMGAYNKVNGVYCCENKPLLTDILRNEWDFKGFTVSDFLFGVHNAVRSVKAGLDVEMPYTFRYAFIEKQLYKGRITEYDVNKCVGRIIRALIVALSKQKRTLKSCVMSKEHIALAREAAEKGIVLLKNNCGALPIKEGAKIAVVGRYADVPNTGDRGSSNVFSPYTVTPYQGLVNRFGKENVVLYGGCDPYEAAQAARDCDYIVVCVGGDYRQEGELMFNAGLAGRKSGSSGGDRTDLKLPAEDIALIRSVSRLGGKSVVNITGGSAYVISDWTDKADAVMMSFYCGLEGGNAIAAVLSGDVNPSGRLPFTVAEKEEDYPEFIHLENKERSIVYDYYHGYTLFDKKKIKPAYPFGFGLSYTEFTVEPVSLTRNGKILSVSCVIANKGSRAGDTVVQVYAGSDETDKERPVRLLKGFGRFSMSMGEVRTVTVEIDTDDLKFYDPDEKKWLLDSSYTVYCGFDSADLKTVGNVTFSRGDN